MIFKNSIHNFLTGKNYEQRLLDPGFRCEDSQNEMSHDVPPKRDINQCKNECDTNTDCMFD